MLALTVDYINRLDPKPRFVVVCGDLTNAMPNGPTAAPEVFFKKKHKNTKTQNKGEKKRKRVKIRIEKQIFLQRKQKMQEIN